ncbi:MAG: response regulator [Candidatus Latescibacterota bacterium]|jgi:DNA-binding response OmpR family regulator
MTTGPDRPRLLLVDDTRTNLTILVETLKQEYRLAVATSGAEALNLARQRPPDLILLDVMMPEMDGYEVCRRLKADEATAAIPVIFVTALTEVGDKAHGFGLGAVDYITKPFEPVEVRARVATHLEIVHQRRELEARNRALEQAQALLRHQLRELEARDALVHVQMSATSVTEAAAAVARHCGQALDAAQALVYLPVAGHPEELTLAATLVPEPRPATVSLRGPETPLVRAAIDRRPCPWAPDRTAAPLLYASELLGVLALEGCRAADVSEEVLSNTLHRLAAASALVLYSALLTERLDLGNAGLEELLAVNPDQDGTHRR